MRDETGTELTLSPTGFGTGFRGHGIPSDSVELSPNESLILDHYFSPGVNFNKMESVRRAGLTSWSRKDVLQIFNRPRVKAEIQRRREVLAEKFDIKAGEVVGELAKIAFFNVGDYIDEDGNLSIKDVPRDALGALTGLEVVQKLDRDGNVIGQAVKIQSKKMEALDRLMRHLNLLQTSGPAGLNVSANKVQICWQDGSRADIPHSGEVIEGKADDA